MKTQSKPASTTVDQQPKPLSAGGWTGSVFLSPVEVRVGLIALVLALAARFQALLPGYAIDDYVFVNQDLPPWFDATAAANGRAMSYVLYAALARLGMAPPGAGVLFILLFTVVLVAVGLIACRLWGLSDHFGESLIVTCFVALHPYHAEMFTFRTATMIVATSLGLAFAAILFCSRSRLYWLLSALSLAGAISIYQGVLNYLGIVILFSIAFEFIRRRAPSPGWLRRMGAQLTLVVAAVLMYVISTFIISRVSGVPLGSRTSLIGADQIGARTIAVVRGASKLFTENEPVLPETCKALLVLTFTAGFGALIISNLLKRPHAPWRRVVILALTAIVGIPLCFGIIIATREWWITPRVLAHASVYWAGLMAMVYTFAHVQVRRVLMAGFVLIFLSFIGINDEVFADQHRVNSRDFAEVNRIVIRIEALPDFRQIKHVVLNGGSWAYASPIRTVETDLNISALYADWAKVGILNEVSGYAFTAAPPDIKAKAETFCATAPKWPAAESVTEIGPAAVVCLPGN